MTFSRHFAKVVNPSSYSISVKGRHEIRLFHKEQSFAMKGSHGFEDQR